MTVITAAVCGRRTGLVTLAIVHGDAMGSGHMGVVARPCSQTIGCHLTHATPGARVQLDDVP